MKDKKNCNKNCVMLVFTKDDAFATLKNGAGGAGDAACSGDRAWA